MSSTIAPVGGGWASLDALGARSFEGICLVVADEVDELIDFLRHARAHLWPEGPG